MHYSYKYGFESVMCIFGYCNYVQLIMATFWCNSDLWYLLEAKCFPPFLPTHISWQNITFLATELITFFLDSAR